MANLTPEQLETVTQWAAGGANLNEVQSRLKTEFGITLTYLDARMLLLDVGVRLKEKERPAPPPEPEPAAVAPPPSAEDWQASDGAGAPPEAQVHVSADPVPLEGTMASGKATFSDGEVVVWYVDGSGRLGMKAPFAGYKPPVADIPIFEQKLDLLLQSL